MKTVQFEKGYTKTSTSWMQRDGSGNITTESPTIKISGTRVGIRHSAQGLATGRIDSTSLQGTKNYNFKEGEFDVTPGDYLHKVIGKIISIGGQPGTIYSYVYYD
jgi:hypothetical protein